MEKEKVLKVLKQMVIELEKEETNQPLLTVENYGVFEQLEYAVNLYESGEIGIIDYAKIASPLFERIRPVLEKLNEHILGKKWNKK